MTGGTPVPSGAMASCRGQFFVADGQSCSPSIVSKVNWSCSDGGIPAGGRSSQAERHGRQSLPWPPMSLPTAIPRARSATCWSHAWLVRGRSTCKVSSFISQYPETRAQAWQSTSACRCETPSRAGSGRRAPEFRSVTVVTASRLNSSPGSLSRSLTTAQM